MSKELIPYRQENKPLISELEAKKNKLEAALALREESKNLKLKLQQEAEKKQILSIRQQIEQELESLFIKVNLYCDLIINSETILDYKLKRRLFWWWFSLSPYTLKVHTFKNGGAFLALENSSKIVSLDTASFNISYTLIGNISDAEFLKIVKRLDKTIDLQVQWIEKQLER